MIKRLALIPARAGSQRVPHKNIRRLRGHPLLAYSIAVARASGCFDRVLVSTDSELIQRIAVHYGADVPFLRPADIATATSPDIFWIKHALSQLDAAYDAFAIVRPTSPFRTVAMLTRAWDQFLSTPGIDSLRAVELCRQHPGKMWIVDGPVMHSLLDQSHLEAPWHAGQYQALPKVYVQNSALEVAWARVVPDTNSREGRVLAPFLTDGLEGFSIDHESDWVLAEHYLTTGQTTLPDIDCAPWPGEAADASH